MKWNLFSEKTPAVYPNRTAAEQGHKFWRLAAAMAPTQVWDTATRTYLTL